MPFIKLKEKNSTKFLIQCKKITVLHQTKLLTIDLKLNITFAPQCLIGNLIKTHFQN